MKTENTVSRDADSCGSAACCTLSPAVSQAGAAPISGGKLFRIATMDCSSEESEIRRALEPISEIRSLGFQLGARTLVLSHLRSSSSLDYAECLTEKA